MKLFVFLSLLLSAALLPVLSRAETVVLNNGEILEGTIKTTEFILHTPYGGIKAAATDLKLISRTEKNLEQFTILTLNNDSFSGALFPETIDLELDSGGRQVIAINRIDKLIFTFNGTSKIIDTTLFFMKNGDQFSGNLLNEALRVQTGQESHLFQRTDFSRLLFYETDTLMANTLLNDGTMVVGQLLEERLQVQPESVSPLSLCKSEIRKIQFNAQKLILLSSPSLTDPAYDSDGDNVADALDKCPETACLTGVNEEGCAAKSPDSDGDGVPDELDQCPGTGQGLPVNSRGCWILLIPYFDFNRADIKPAYYSLLNQAVEILKSMPDMEIEIQGHTDARGAAEYNLLLSERRADEVRRFFVSQGIDRQRLTVTGYGEAEPVVPNETDASRAQNRRVMLIQTR